MALMLRQSNSGRVPMSGPAEVMMSGRTIRARVLSTFRANSFHMADAAAGVRVGPGK